MRRFSYTVLLFALISTASFAQTDSLGIERQGDKVFVIHKVQPQQTLYSLSRRYKTTVSEINRANPILESGLQIGQTLKIPFGGEIISPDATVSKRTDEVTHTVKAGETLFAIARKYDVQVSDIKTWNSLSSNALDLGQKLVIRKEVLVAIDPEPKIATDSQKTIDVPETLKVSDKPFSQDSTKSEANVNSTSVDEPESVDYPGTPFVPIETEGLAEVIEEAEPSSKFFALHRTAKVGTVIKVKNLMNNLTVYVRVIGTIPETSDNENILIKLNQRAYDHLKAIDKRFRVQLNYFK